MLPVLALATFLLEMAATSPVYNMQPAFITANIGTTGRNIRNLPCISRKNNQSGVCMFAIDCLKANGTHLGTCIDRFYFGSCCHIEPLHDIIENSIDTDIIPSREPPLRVSTTTTSTTLSTTTTKIKPTTTTTTTSKPTTTTRRATTTTSKPSTTTTKSSTTTTKPRTTTTPKPSTTTTTSKPEPTSTTSYKLTTFQSVDGNVATETTTKVPTPITQKPKPTKVTKKPSTTTTRKPTSKPRPSSVSISTTQTTTKKPSSTTTKKPVTTPKPTNKVTVSKTTTKLTTTTTTTTPKPASTTTTTTIAPEVVLHKNVSDVVGSSSASSTTTKATIITWAVVDGTTNVTTSPSTSATNSTSEDWMPLTTPDNWVPLGTVQLEATNVTSTTESASKPSITYIPLEATTALNGSSAEGTTTQAAPVTNGTTETPSTTLAEIRPVNMSDFTDVCGRRMYPEARIVGGEKSSFGKWPWQISLRQWRTSTYLHKCGAALLNENWAITAAHCVDNVPPSDLLLRLGEHDLSTESEPYLHQERRVQIVASHPHFDPRTFEYDLALLRFYEPVTFQPNILPVCVPQADESFVGRTAYVTGWGRLYEDGPLPSVLQEVSVPVINNSVCESMYRLAGYIEHIPHIFICAGWRRGGFDSCEGDSGGPMVIQREDKRFLLAGVISWGIGCAEPNQPGVYTRISEFRDWINQILQF